MRCAQYWPDDGEEHYGTVSVTLKESDSFADFDIRTFIINVVCIFYPILWIYPGSAGLIIYIVDSANQGPQRKK